jgi:hypothetical protein
MPLEIPFCNYFQIQNQNPYYVVFCSLEKQLIMTEHCNLCKNKNSNPNLHIIYENASFHIQNANPIATLNSEKKIKKKGLDIWM